MLFYVVLLYSIEKTVAVCGTKETIMYVKR